MSFCHRKGDFSIRKEVSRLPLGSRLLPHGFRQLPDGAL